jgi:uncharacterized protein YjbJ (UPF0337 family)
MDKNRVKGTIDEAVGSAKRQVGKLTGNTKIQVEGSVQQIKGKVENAWGKVKDEVRKGNECVTASPIKGKGSVSVHGEVVVVKDRNQNQPTQN